MSARTLKLCCAAIAVAAATLAAVAPAHANPIPIFPIKTMSVDFNSALAERFTFDNLAFGDAGLEHVLLFGEVPFQPVHGLTVTTLSGKAVTFGFTEGGLPSADANYNSGGPGVVTYVQDPSLEGTTDGELTVTFAEPVHFIAFGLALSTAEAGVGATVRLLLEDGTDLSDIQAFDNVVEVEPIVSFSEGRFSIPSAAPEPGTALLAAAGLFAAVSRLRRRRG